MIRRIRRSMRWFGAIAALLLLPIPVHADDIEPEPYVEENLEPEPKAEAEEAPATEIAAASASTGPGVGSKIFDCIFLRPFGFARTILGGALFVPAVALAAPGGAENIEEAWDLFVGVPVEDTFKRPLGGDF